MKSLVIIIMVLGFTACGTTNNFTTNVAGASDRSTVVVKDFTTLGIITVRSTEIHYSSPLGLNKRLEGSKITFADLMHEAAKLEADDIINVRIDMNTNYRRGAFDWLTGWTRTFTYTGTALAIRYTDMLESAAGDPQLGELPRTPQDTRAVRTTREGEVVLR